jgi:uncharacterized Zn finger protein
MKITIHCPACGIGQDITLEPTQNPIFEEYYLDAYKPCPNCGLVIHVAMTGNPKDKDTPF